VTELVASNRSSVKKRSTALWLMQSQLLTFPQRFRLNSIHKSKDPARLCNGRETPKFPASVREHPFMGALFAEVTGNDMTGLAGSPHIGGDSAGGMASHSDT
jgi:hypothetical protein